jgi:hypothetical protein
MIRGVISTTSDRTISSDALGCGTILPHLVSLADRLEYSYGTDNLPIKRTFPGYKRKVQSMICSERGILSMNRAVLKQEKEA